MLRNIKKRPRFFWNQGRSLLKTAATYSPTSTQYHRRDEA
jgi:hypothetical protein